MKIIFFAGIVFLSLFVINRGLEADETVTSPGKALTVEEFIGTDDAYLEPTMFPIFYNDNSDNPGCATTSTKGEIDEYGQKCTGDCNDVSDASGISRWKNIDVDTKGWGKDIKPYSLSGSAFKDCSVKVGGNCNYSNCARTLRSCNSIGYCQNIYKPCKEGIYNNDADGSPQESYSNLAEGEYQKIPGLSGTIKPAEGYRNITKILFTWIVRLEGYKRILAVWPFICHPHHKTSYQEFPPGPLKTRLYVQSNALGNGVKQVADDGTISYVSSEFVPVGQIAEMTVPSAGKGKISNPGDPTITGSYALLPSDFEKGKIPPEVYAEVRWYNKTSMRIRSPGKQRNLIATVFPVTNQRSEE